MKWTRIMLSACLGLPAMTAIASGPESDVATFAAGQPIPATLTLYETKGDPAGRLTPIYDNYRPKVSFGSGDIICMFHLEPPVKKVAPGETASVTLACKEAITVAKDGARFVVKEGGKEVGFGTAHARPSQAAR